MISYKITLQEYLNKYGTLETGMIVKSVLVDKLEVYGFVNSGIIDYIDYILNKGIVGKAPTNQIIQSNYMYQVMDIEGESKGVVTPIYNTLKKSKKDLEVDIKQLYIPDLVNNDTYRRLRSRYKDGNQPIVLKAYEERTLKEYLEISIKEGRLMVHIHEGDILCCQLCQYNLEESIKSIGKEILVVCRYIHDLTGNMCYTQYGLDELTIEITEDYSPLK